MAELHDEADQIEAVLTEYQVPARVHGGSMSPQVTRFYLWLGGSVAATAACIAALTDEIARTLGRSDCRLGRQGRTLFLELPRPPEETTSTLATAPARASLPPTDSALLGVTPEQQPLFVRFPSDEVGHLLLCGAAGCGKTALLRALALSLAEANHPRRWRIVPLGGDDGGLAPLAALPHTWGHARTVESAIGWLVRLSAELERRATARATAPSPHDPRPRLLVLVDDIAALLAVGGGTARLALSRLLARGREGGIHLVAAATESEPLGALAADFPLWLVGQAAGATLARRSHWAEAAARLAPGDFLALPTGGGFWRFRAAWAAPGDVALEVQRWQQGRPRVVAQPLLPALPAPRRDETAAYPVRRAQ